MMTTTIKIKIPLSILIDSDFSDDFTRRSLSCVTCSVVVGVQAHDGVVDDLHEIGLVFAVLLAVALRVLDDGLKPVLAVPEYVLSMYSIKSATISASLYLYSIPAILSFDVSNLVQKSIFLSH